MALKMASMPLFTPFLIIMSTCEHRYIIQNRPDARKNSPQTGQKGHFWPLSQAVLRASLEVALPPSMLATRNRIGRLRLYDDYLFLTQHLDT